MARRDWRNPRARLAAADTARYGVLSRPNSAAIRPPCVLVPLGPALAGPPTRVSPIPPSERGQATVEVVAALSLLLLAAGVALQLLVAGYALTLADGAAEAGALALAAGQSAKQAAREALPDWARAVAEVSVRGGEVRVMLRPPLALPQLADRLAVTSVAHARPAER